MKTLILDLDETLVHSSLEFSPNADIAIIVNSKSNKIPIYIHIRPFAIEFL